jgi:hypothetical protein
MTSKVQVDAPRLWLVLLRCHRALNQIAERGIEEAGLCLTDFAALEALLHKGPLTITEIQGKVPLAIGSMTAAVARLEKRIRDGSFERERKASAPRSFEKLGSICGRSWRGNKKSRRQMCHSSPGQVDSPSNLPPRSGKTTVQWTAQHASRKSDVAHTKSILNAEKNPADLEDWRREVVDSIHDELTADVPAWTSPFRVWFRQHNTVLKAL